MSEIKMSDWLISFEQSLITYKTIILTGNIKDLFRFENHWLSLSHFIAKYLESKNYEIIGIFDIIGEQINDETKLLRFFTESASKKVDELYRPALSFSPETSLREYLELFKLLLSNTTYRTAIIIEFADKIFSSPESQSEEGKKNSILTQKITEASAENVKGPYNNVLIALFPIENQIPIDLYYNNPSVKIISIPKPDKSLRQQYWSEKINDFYPFINTDSSKKDRNQWVDDMADITDGFLIKELASLIEISNEIRHTDPKELIRIFRFGRKESPWQSLSVEKIINEAEKTLKKRVKGQDEAIRAVCEMLLNAQTGIANLLRPNRPKGVFFFVGPTGVGKTELAKALANFLFGSDDAMIRFDMSEYSQEHAGERLVGAPPGYIGFEKGGQLVNAVREKPFSVLLFDEIEKAHGRVLDKFLQILEDGRLTDGRGITAYFSDTVIIFTSNIGQVYEVREDEVKTEEEKNRIREINQKIQNFINTAPYNKKAAESVNSRVELKIYGQTFTNLVDYFKAAVENYFRNKLQRPELLRRVGYDNIIVFNRINEELKEEIIRAKLREFGEKLCASGIGPSKFEWGSELEKFLATHPEGFSKGGAGGMMNLIRQYVEKEVAFAIARRKPEFIGKTMYINYKNDEIQIIAL